MLHVTESSIELIGSRPMRIFKKGIETYEVNPGDNIEFLIKRTK
jgi:dipeptidase E